MLMSSNFSYKKNLYNKYRRDDIFPIVKLKKKSDCIYNVSNQ